MHLPHGSTNRALARDRRCGLGRAARDREVVHRRDIAERLAEKYNRGDTENMREAFIKIQETIEAIERAVWHERYIAGQKSEPFSPFGFGS